VKYKHYIVLTICVLLWSCSSTPQYTNPLPTSKEATYVENISGKGDRYIAWGIGEDNIQAEEDALKAGLYAAMCGGAAGNVVPLMSTAEQMKHRDFIEGFFTHRDEWSKYVQSTSQGRIDPDKRLRLEDGRVKLGVDIIVNRDGLREYLEYMNVVGGMRIGN
jgi:hypothetical protein